MKTQQKKIIPADIYDALELSVLANGGKIGSGTCDKFVYDKDGNEVLEDPNDPLSDAVVVPVCLLGHINFLAGEHLGDYAPRSALAKEMIAVLGEEWGDTCFETDRITGPNDAIVDRLDTDGDGYVTWKQYTKARGWVRGA